LGSTERGRGVSGEFSTIFPIFFLLKDLQTVDEDIVMKNHWQKLWRLFLIPSPLSCQLHQVVFDDFPDDFKTFYLHCQLVSLAYLKKILTKYLRLKTSRTQMRKSTNHTVMIPTVNRTNLWRPRQTNLDLSNNILGHFLKLTQTMRCLWISCTMPQAVLLKLKSKMAGVVFSPDSDPLKLRKKISLRRFSA
jgi:hypothetical protein